jgi:hypothetical protein
MGWNGSPCYSKDLETPKEKGIEFSSVLSVVGADGRH